MVKKLAVEAQVSVAEAPPRLTVALVPKAAKPPLPVNCTWVAPVPRPRAKLAVLEVSPTTPPLISRLLVPRVDATPPGRAPALFSSRTPPVTLVVPV